MKLVQFEMAADAGVNLWLHSSLVDTVVDDNRVTGIRIHNKSGYSELSARVLIDTTGDADVAVGSGACFVQDIPEASLNATLLFQSPALIRTLSSPM